MIAEFAVASRLSFPWSTVRRAYRNTPLFLRTKPQFRRAANSLSIQPVDDWLPVATTIADGLAQNRYERHYRILVPPWRIGEECCYSPPAQALGHSFPALSLAGVELNDALLGRRHFSPVSPEDLALKAMTKAQMDNGLRSPA